MILGRRNKWMRMMELGVSEWQCWVHNLWSSREAECVHESNKRVLHPPLSFQHYSSLLMMPSFNHKQTNSNASPYVPSSHLPVPNNMCTMHHHIPLVINYYYQLLISSVLHVFLGCGLDWFSLPTSLGDMEWSF